MKNVNSLISQNNLPQSFSSYSLFHKHHCHRFLIVLFLSFFLFAFVSINVQASHFRYGNIAWRVVGPRTIEFKVTEAYRRSFFFGSPTLGSTVNTGLMNFGDGSGANINLTVTSVNDVQDWFYGEYTVRHTYTADGAYTANFEGCCRLSTLQNNADESYRVETIVNVGTGNNSPVVTLPPIRILPNDLTNATFPIPATDFEGDALTYRLATNAETGGVSNPTGLTVNPTTGFVNWTTLGKPDGLYNAAVAITDARGAKVVVDFLISVQAVPPPPPVFDFTVTPNSSTPIEAQVGQAVNFNIRATDQPPIDVVTISAIGMPTGATLTPALAMGNPVQTSFSWTPTTPGSFVITFVAEDNRGNQTTTSVTINVSNCNLTLTAVPTHVTSSGGNNGAIDLSVSGGTAPYTYNWSNGSATQDITGLMTGTYSVTVVDATGSCRQTTSVTINAGSTNGPNTNITLSPGSRIFNPGQWITVTFDMPGNFNSNNTFILQLSDANGSFASPTVLMVDTYSPISAQLPMNLPAGNKYRIRIVSTSPAITGADNGQDITIIGTSITTASFGGTYTAGQWVTVPFTTTGTFLPGNMFTLQLSDASGSFASPMILKQSAYGPLSAQLPMNLAPGSKYRMRIVSTSPVVTGTDNGQDITIIGPSITTATLGGSYRPGQWITVPFTTTGTFGNGNIFTLQLSDANGSFASPTMLKQSAWSPISAPIPMGIASGTGYRVRIVSSSPAITGTDNGQNITISSSSTMSTLAMSNIGELKETRETTGLTLSPNPSSDRTIAIKIGSLMEKDNQLYLDVYDMTGNRVLAKTYNRNSGSFKERLNLNQLKAGMYWVRIKAGKELFQEKLILQ